VIRSLRLVALMGVLSLAALGLAPQVAASASGSGTDAPTGPAVTKYSNVVYKNIAPNTLKLDVYVPDGPGPFPALLMVHGVGWSDGTKKDVQTYAQDYAAMGFVTYAPDYRESCDPANPPAGTPPYLCGYVFPTHLEDLRDALIFVRTVAPSHPEWKTNGTWVGVWGSSSGGNLAGNLANGWTACGCAEGTPGFDKPDAVISWSGPMNLQDGGGDPVQPGRLSDYLGCDPFSDPPECPDGLTAKVSPYYNITPDDPPFFQSGGVTDQIAPLATQIQPTQDALLAAGITAQLYRIQGNCHGIKCKPADSGLESNSADWAHSILDRTKPTVHIETGPVHQGKISVATFTFSSAAGVSKKCGLDGAALAACTSPKTYSNVQPGAHTFTVQGTDVTGTGGASTSTWTIVPQAVTVMDFAYNPANPKADMGGWIQWTNTGPSQHTVTDKSGMGFFDSGPMNVGATFRQTFVGAGTYYVISTLDPSMQGSIKVSMTATPPAGPAGASFVIAWAVAPPPAGYVYDVQMKAPGGGFTNWKMGQTGGQTSTTLSTVGTYQFRAHLKNTANGKFSGWSPALSVQVN
jgi:acetyl esterase/lipase/plastocyanin